MREVSISVVVMAFDEAASLEAVVDELEATLLRLDIGYQVLIIDDGSSDDTGEIADRLAGGRGAVEVVHHGENLGLGGVYRTGLFESCGRFVTFLPADGQFPPTAIEKFLPLSANHDLVLGYLPVRRHSAFGALLSRLERALHFVLFGSTPRFQGVFLLRREVLDAYTLESSGRGWGIVMEMILRTQRAGFRIVSVPTEIRPRMAGHSKVQDSTTVWSNLLQLLQVRWALWSGDKKPTRT
jgi:glycosyltransferase involved in cell wall biosynthesis